MRKFLASFFLKLSKKFSEKDTKSPVLVEKTELYEDVIEVAEVLQAIKPKEPKVKKPKPPRLPELSPQERAARDITEMMEVPFLALSKNRKEPIIYEKHDGKNMMRVKVSRHTGHFLASIYDGISCYMHCKPGSL